ncbi:MAG: type II secretion system F family protein, partial [Deltaproteobacteria bacterium]
EQQGFFVFRVRKKSFSFLWDRGHARQKVSQKDILAFNQEMLVLIKAGLPIIQVLDAILERAEKGNLTEILRSVREEIKGGAALSDALEKFPKGFSHLYIASIRAGEKTGDLPQTIRRYIDFLKKSGALKKKLLAALLYPAILVTVAIMAITLLLVYVVPTFSQIFSDAGSRLPLPTIMLINFSVFLKHYFLVIISVVTISVLFFRRWTSSGTGRFWLDGIKLRLPFIGDLITKYSVAAFTRTFATVLGSGIPVIESLRMSLGTLNNKVLERKLLEATLHVEEGISLATALESVKMMPPLAVRMLGVGETTGSLEEMLADISDYFEEEVEGRVTLLTTAIEPLIMLFMGLVIGAIVITMYLPIFRIASTVG